MSAAGIVRRLALAALPVVAVLSFVLAVAATVAVAGDTLGYDFLAYHQAAERVLRGQPLYDMSFTETGGFGLFYYPPTFAPFLLPFGLLPANVATWSWIALSLAAFLLGVALLPVSRTIRWSVLLLAGWSWPFVYAVKLGQVGPILFLAFAVGWRWLHRPGVLGASGAVGAAIKVQPGLVLVWALLARRLSAVIAGGAVLLGLALVATLLAGPRAWLDFLALLGSVSDPIRTEHNFTPGAVVWQLGASAETALLVQLVTTFGAAVALLAATRWASDEGSYLAAVVVSQLVSPILWDHYAMLLLLPVAYLLSAGHWWAVLIPLVTSTALVGVTPALAYPTVFVVALVGTLLVGIRSRRRGRRREGHREDDRQPGRATGTGAAARARDGGAHDVLASG